MGKCFVGDEGGVHFDEGLVVVEEGEGGVEGYAGGEGGFMVEFCGGVEY